MKRISLFLLLAILCLPVYSQELRIGAEAGFISSIDSNYGFSNLENRRNTYYTGLNATKQFTDHLSVTTGLHYLRQGYQHETCYEFAEGVKNRLTGKKDYLILPLTANLHFGYKNRFIATLGIYVAQNIRAVQDYPEPISGCKIYYFPDVSFITHDQYLGGIAGVGYTVMDSEKFRIDSFLKCYQSLTKIDPYSNASSLLVTVAVSQKLRK